MTKTEATNLHRDLTNAIQTVLNKYNIRLTSNSLRFGEREVKLSLGMEQLNADGTHKADDYTEAMLKHEFSICGVQNIPTTIVGSKVRSFSGKIFTITGYNRKAQKYPIEAQEVTTGQMYKMRADGLRFIA